MCGIVGFYEHEDVMHKLVYGLTALQHRGQDAAGIVTYDHAFHLKKGMGLVNNVFRKKHFKQLTGNMGIGHVRYTTQGSNDLTNAQPFFINYPFGLAMIHNGNVVNFEELKNTLFNEKRIVLETTNDLELILYIFAAELGIKDWSKLSPDDIFDAVEVVQQKVKGAYSTISVIANQGLLVFTDPYGIRPLVMGKKLTRRGPIYGFASESTCFDLLEYDTIENLKPGQAIFIDMERNVHRRDGFQLGKKFCIFEYIYFAKEDTAMHNRLIAGERVKMGRQLAKKVREAGLEPDIVIDVPTSGYWSASGLAEGLDIPYRRGFSRNNFIGRSFISPTQKERENIVKRKLNPIKKVVEGKKIAVVDDSIVRGTTSRRIVQMLKKAGAKEVYFISAAPPIKYPCFYGIDMAESTELIASKNTYEEITKFMGADALIYQSLEDLKEIYDEYDFCDACFSGDYPTGDIEKYKGQVQAERKLSKM